MMRCIIFLILAVIPIAGCSGQLPPPPMRIVETQEMLVEVPVRRQLPGELVRSFVPSDIPTFVPPADPDATSALTPDGERKLKLLILDLTTRDDAWRAWATTP